MESSKNPKIGDGSKTPSGDGKQKTQIPDLSFIPDPKTPKTGIKSALSKETSPIFGEIPAVTLQELKRQKEKMDEMVKDPNELLKEWKEAQIKMRILEEDNKRLQALRTADLERELLRSRDVTRNSYEVRKGKETAFDSSDTSNDVEEIQGSVETDRKSVV